MRLVDTSAWIEWAAGSAIGSQIVPLLPDEREWLVPTIVQYELAKWESRMRVDPEQGLELVAYSNNCVVVPLSTALAVEASSHHLRRAFSRSAGCDLFEEIPIEG